jgi:hypothetical protein
MRYFKNEQNETYAIEPGQEVLIRSNWQEISETEALAFTPEQQKIMRIGELKRFLSETDYKVLPDYDKPNESIKVQRQEWRNELRQLEAQ